MDKTIDFLKQTFETRLIADEIVTVIPAVVDEEGNILQQEYTEITPAQYELVETTVIPDGWYAYEDGGVSPAGYRKIANYQEVNE